MKRNITKMLEKWNKEANNPLFLSGIFGVGKTYICNDFAKNNFESYFWFKLPKKNNLDFGTENTNPEVFLQNYFEADIDILRTSPVIFDDTEENIGFFKTLLKFAVANNCKWIFVSEYDWTRETVNRDNITFLKMYPMQFDEFLVASGNEWYSEIIKTHTGIFKKIPDMVHTELISNFDEYMWVGGMPGVLNEYFLLKNEINTTRKQEETKKLVYLLNEKRESILKINQITDAVDFNLSCQTKKFVIKSLGTNVSLSDFEDKIGDLILKGKLLKEEILQEENIEKSSKFKLYYPEFSFLPTMNFNEITDVEYKAREENYIFETLIQNEIKALFWDSGNNARLNFVLDAGDLKIIADYRSDNKSNAKSIESFKNKTGYGKTLKISSSNFVDNGDVKNIPAYSLFSVDNEFLQKNFS